jgi:protein-arginine kinase activator protein McsA
MTKEELEIVVEGRGYDDYVSLTCHKCGVTFQRKAGAVRKNIRRGIFNVMCSATCSVLTHVGTSQACMARKDETAERFKRGELLRPSTLRNHMLRAYPHECAICGISEWCGQPTPLIVDHINGDSSNNFPDNLRLVCPNCDAQLPTFKNKNRGNGRASRRKRYADGKSY